VRASLLSLATAVTLAASCGDQAVPPLQSAETCAGAWQPLSARYFGDERGDFSFAPWAIAYANGLIYYDTSTTAAEIVALPVAGGSPSPVVPFQLAVTGLWAEGDHLLFANGSKFYSVPLTGGTPSLLFDALGGQQIPDESLVQDVSPTHFYWNALDMSADGQSGMSVWRAARTGGNPVKLGFVPDNVVLPGVGGMALASDAVLFAGDLGFSAVVPFDGGAVRALAPGGDYYCGVDSSGAYWASVVGDPTEERFTIVFSPADGGARRTFWAYPPRHTLPFRIWQTGDGSWLVIALQRFSDGLTHTSFWELDAAGNARLLACDPGGGNLSPYIDTRPAFTPEAAFFMASYVEATGTLAWEIARIAR